MRVRAKLAKLKVYKFEVIHPMRPNGMKFTSLTEALKFTAYCLKSGESHMTISAIIDSSAG